MMKAEIINRGRGPEIAGTRISVYDILDYTRSGWNPASIAVVLRLSSDQVRAAIQYIEEHNDEVIAAHDRILARDAAGNPPEIRVKLEASRAKLQKMIAERRGRKREAPGAGIAGALAPATLFAP